MRKAIVAMLLLAGVFAAGCGTSSHGPARTSGTVPPAPAAFTFHVVNDRSEPVTILQCLGLCRVHVATGSSPSTTLTCNTSCRQHGDPVSLAAGASHDFTGHTQAPNAFLALDGQDTVLGCLPVLNYPAPPTTAPTIRVSAASQCTFRSEHRPGLLHRISRWLHRL